MLAAILLLLPEENKGQRAQKKGVSTIFGRRLSNRQRNSPRTSQQRRAPLRINGEWRNGKSLLGTFPFNQRDSHDHGHHGHHEHQDHHQQHAHAHHHDHQVCYLPIHESNTRVQSYVQT